MDAKLTYPYAWSSASGELGVSGEVFLDSLGDGVIGFLLSCAEVCSVGLGGVSKVMKPECLTSSNSLRCSCLLIFWQFGETPINFADDLGPCTVLLKETGVRSWSDESKLFAFCRSDS